MHRVLIDQGEFIVPLPYAIWLYLLTQAPDSFAYRLLSIKPFRWLGDVSFPVYLFHKPVYNTYAFIRLGFSGVKDLRVDGGTGKDSLSKTSVLSAASFLSPWSTSFRDENA